MRRILLLIIPWLLLIACAPDEPQYENISGFALGKTVQINYWSETLLDNHTIQEQVEQTLEQIEKTLGSNDEQSAIERFNSKQSNDNQQVGNDIVELVKISQTITELSQGCFDLTTRPLFKLWGFDTDSFTVPDQAAIQQTLSQVGMSKINIKDDSHLQKTMSAVQIDVSALLQGYIANKLSKDLESFGINNYQINVGSGYKSYGHKPGGGAWVVSIDKALPGEKKLHKLVALPKDLGMSVMAASTYGYYFDAYGHHYSRVMDARTGKPVTHNLVAVIVMHENPIMAEAWASALLCLGAEPAIQLANAEKLYAYFIRQQGTELRETQSTALRDATGLSIR